MKKHIDIVRKTQRNEPAKPAEAPTASEKKAPQAPIPPRVIESEEKGSPIISAILIVLVLAMVGFVIYIYNFQP